jgi:cysteinyl-tRNA synthetase
MDDDFNTPEAFSVLFEIVKEINKQKEGDPVLANQLGALLVKLANLLGILQSTPAEFLRSNVATDVDEEEIDQLIAARKQARADKDWALADEIRDKLAAIKVVVEDGADGSGWRIER